MCWFTLKRIAIIVFLINLLLVILTLLIFWSGSPDPSPKKSSHMKKMNVHEADPSISPESLLSVDRFSSLNKDSSQDLKRNNFIEEEEEETHVIEIWSKAAIGYYLWQHILKGDIKRNIENGMYVFSSKKISNLKLKFRSGPSLTIESLRRFVTEYQTGSSIKSMKKNKKKAVSSDKNLILVMNGRDEEKVETAISWLQEVTLLSNFLRQQQSNQSLNIGVILLGNELCFNSWIQPFLVSSGGTISFLFITYDWKLIDDEEVFQWPLGVATYRSFPVPDMTSRWRSTVSETNNDSIERNVINQNEVQSTGDEDRLYICNFLGTIYTNSSREELLQVVSNMNQKYTERNKTHKPLCFLKTRSKWVPSETQSSRDIYVEALKSSDFTLNPIGKNHECYRIYEAMQMGSIPVLEENLSVVEGNKSSCDQSSAYRLLKRYEAPVLFVKNWTSQLPLLIQQEVNQVSKQQKITRRREMLQWYQQFQEKMRDVLLRVVRQKFFSS